MPSDNTQQQSAQDQHPLTDRQQPATGRRETSADRDQFSVRQFLATAVLFAIIVLTLRAVALEPFGVPTGSMAPALFGNHKECTCPRCGYSVVIGAANDQRGGPDASRNAYANAFCPNCYQGNLHIDRCPETVGDRLLVDKSVFDFRPPRRWEVAVFHNPSDLSKPYVKRVVGLPGEAIQIREGDVYINGQLARKSFDQCRAMRVPVFDNDFQPQGDGWNMRWRRMRPSETPAQLADDKSLSDADEHLDGAALKWLGRENDFEWLVYRHWLIDEKREELIRDWFAYNGGALHHELSDVHDFMVEFEIETGNGSGAFGVKLCDGQTTATVEIPIVGLGQAPEGVRLLGVDKASPSRTNVHLKEKSKHRVEFALVDRRVMLAIDGREAFEPLDLSPALNRSAVSRPVWLGSKGVPATVRHFRLFRDVHYSASGRNAVYDPWPLGQDEYFMLGDNSPNSEDSRYWSEPGIPERNFLGKPVLLHQPSRWGHLGSWQMQFLDWDRIQWIR